MLRHSAASLDFLKQSEARHARKLTSRAMFLPSVVGVEGRRTAGGRASVSISKVKRINQTLAEPYWRTSAHRHFIGGRKAQATRFLPSSRFRKQPGPSLERQIYTVNFTYTRCPLLQTLAS